ncbi:hypothetical protein MKW92_049832, partial [Papaver armeniacum]
MHFFEIFHTSIITDKRLDLPKEFTVKYGKKLSNNAIIKVPNGIWHIGMRKAEGVISFENGWQEFMEFYSICLGHVILFRYDGNSKFQVHIFGTDAMEIDYPSHIDNTNHEVGMTSIHLDEDEVEVVSIHSDSTQSDDEPSMSSESPLNQKAKPARNEFPQKSRKRKAAIPTTFHTKALQATVEAVEGFEFENPFFKVTMHVSYIKGPLRVPNDFANSYLRNITQRGIILRISDGRTWEVRYVPGTQYNRRLSQGWYKFVADNHLKEGDICVFELVDREKLEMNVHIFHQQKTFDGKVTPKLKHLPEFKATLKEAEEFKSENPQEFSQETPKQRTVIPAKIHTKAFKATLEASEAFKSKNPSFKRILQASHLKGILKVPIAFVRSYLKNRIRMMISLRISDGRTWEVRYIFRPQNGRPESSLSKGWYKFVTDNYLKEGDICVFELVDRKKMEMTKLTPKIRYYTAEFQATLEAAREFKSENPFFKIVMQASYIQRRLVRVPAVFGTSHLKNITQMVITLRVPDGRTWEVGYVSQTPTERRISQGWGKFVADNDLKEGDVCVFELVDSKKNLEMNVHIFRLVHDL